MIRARCPGRFCFLCSGEGDLGRLDEGRGEGDLLRLLGFAGEGDLRRFEELYGEGDRREVGRDSDRLELAEGEPSRLCFFFAGSSFVALKGWGWRSVPDGSRSGPAMLMEFSRSWVCFARMFW